MKLSIEIPRNLPRFDGAALFIVSGKQDAVIYRAAEGEISRLDAFKIPRPRVLGPEAKMKPRGRVMGERSGAVREYGDENVIRDFLKEFKRRFSGIKEQFERIYIFAPKEMQRKLAESLSDSDRNKIAGEIEGNFYYRHPLDLVKRIAADSERGFVPASEEEKKILDVPKQK